MQIWTLLFLFLSFVLSFAGVGLLCFVSCLLPFVFHLPRHRQRLRLKFYALCLLTFLVYRDDDKHCRMKRGGMTAERRNRGYEEQTESLFEKQNNDLVEGMCSVPTFVLSCSRLVVMVCDLLVAMGLFPAVDSFRCFAWT